jgi:phosphoglycolate phosphatase-like HAD superfamily hydrolase
MKRSGQDRHVQLAATGADTLYATFLTEWLQRIEQPDLLALDRLFDGAVEKLQQWRREQRRLILATLRHSPEQLKWQLNRLGLAPLLDDVLVADHRGGAARKAEMVKEIISDPSTTLWIGDTELDIEAARLVGCRIFAVSSGLRAPEFLERARPDHIFSSLAEVSID